jgi:F-type H+-transporting ATPase subunit delta
MKLTPRQLADSLYIALDDKTDTSKVARNFWKFLQKKKMTSKINQILLAFKTICQQKNPQLTVRVESAREVPEDILDKIKSQFRKRYPQKTIQLELIINPELIGGIKLSTPSSQLDLSIKNRLLKLKEQI